VGEGRGHEIEIVALRAFDRQRRGILAESAVLELQRYLAWNPLAGDVIPGTGGLRKLRWAAKGHGKRGGARVIYYYADRGRPLYLLAVYAKNEKVDLSAREKKQMAALVDLLRDADPRRIEGARSVRISVE